MRYVIEVVLSSAVIAAIVIGTSMAVSSCMVSKDLVLTVIKK